MSKSDYLENAILKHVLGKGATGTTLTAPSTLYLGLFTTMPDEATSSGGTEVSGGAYARQSIAFTVSSSTATSSGGAITFPQATASWGTVVGWGVFDALTSGNLLYYGTVTSKAIAASDTASVASGQIVITEN